MIVVTAIQTLGSYEAFLAAVVMCGAIQIGLGIVGAGAIGDYVPNSVIKGMLAGIGLVIVLKQIPHALGHDLDWIGDLSFWEAWQHEHAVSHFRRCRSHPRRTTRDLRFEFGHPGWLGETRIRRVTLFHSDTGIRHGRCTGNSHESSLPISWPRHCTLASRSTS